MQGGPAYRGPCVYRLREIRLYPTTKVAGLSRVLENNNKKWKDLIESQTEATDYFSFCENLEIFCSKLQKKNVKYLLQSKLKLFASPFLVSCLSEYGNIIRDKVEKLHYGETPENEEKEKDLWFVLYNFLVENPGWVERRFSED